MIKNLWMQHAEELAEAYTRHDNSVRFELVTRALNGYLAATPQRIVDIGGGYGYQAIMLARAGHSVVIVDIDPNMLDVARYKVSSELLDVRSRIGFVLGDGADAVSLVGGDFDLACCHSVLMYQDDPAPILHSLVNLVHPNGLISVLCINREASAMRSGLQGRWKEAIRSINAGRQIDDQYLPTYEHTRGEVIATIKSAGANVVDWYGVGVFTDHVTEPIVVDDPEDVYMAEWLAGSRDPYRQVARCFHIIAERV